MVKKIRLYPINKEEKIAMAKALISKIDGNALSRLSRKAKSIALESTIKINPNGLMRAKKFFIII